MLEKMGWIDGKGLGINEDGKKEHIKIQKKDNNLGMITIYTGIVIQLQ